MFLILFLTRGNVHRLFYAFWKRFSMKAATSSFVCGKMHQNMRILEQKMYEKHKNTRKIQVKQHFFTKKLVLYSLFP